MKLANLRFTLACTALAVGCGASTEIKSARDPGFHDQVAKLFVISEVGAEHDSQYTDDGPTRTSATGTHHVTIAAQFKDALIREAAACHVELDVSSVSKLDLDPKAHLERMQSFGARYVLTLKETGGLKNQKGVVIESTYDAQLTDRETTDHLVWRGDMRLSHGGIDTSNEGLVVARDLLKKLDADRIIAPCPALKQRELADEREAAHRKGQR